MEVRGEREDRGTWSAVVQGTRRRGAAGGPTFAAGRELHLRSPCESEILGGDSAHATALRHRHAHLAIGDSLTAGYCMPPPFKPWAPVLSKLLPGTPRVDHIGCSGWTTSQLVAAADSASVSDVCGDEWPGARHQLGSVKYDVGIIMGGTNDLAYGVSAKDIVANLASLHQMCWDAGALKTVLCSIPPSAGSGNPAHGEANEALARGPCARSKVLFVDSSSLVPFARSSPLWMMDGLHMTAEGYEQFGTRLADAIAGFVAAPGSGS